MYIYNVIIYKHCFISTDIYLIKYVDNPKDFLISIVVVCNFIADWRI